MPPLVPTVESRGEVMAIANGIAEIRTENSACGGCKRCGQGAEDNFRTFRHDASGLQVGQTVTLSLAESSLVAGAGIAYLLPALTLLAGAIIGAAIGEAYELADAAAALGAGIGLAVGLRLTRLLSKSRLSRFMVPQLRCGTADLPIHGEKP
jgi:positive regulator of sigma E activity